MERVEGTNKKGERYVKYYLNGELHRSGNWAVRWWDVDGRLVSEQWWFNGNLHRKHEWAWRSTYDGCDDIYQVIYSVHGEYHNLSGPAHVGSDKKGNEIEDYYIRGVKLTEEEWKKSLAVQVYHLINGMLPLPIAEEIIEYYV